MKYLAYLKKQHMSNHCAVSVMMTLQHAHALSLSCMDYTKNAKSNLVCSVADLPLSGYSEEKVMYVFSAFR